MTHIAFISGTRADYGKIRPYIDFLTQEQNRKVSVFVTGMNMLKKYGSTYRYIQKDLNKTLCFSITMQRYYPSVHPFCTGK